MYSVTIVEWFHGPGTGWATYQAKHLRSAKRAMELAKQSKPTSRGCTDSCLVLIEVTVKRNNKIISHNFS